MRQARTAVFARVIKTGLAVLSTTLLAQSGGALTPTGKMAVSRHYHIYSYLPVVIFWEVSKPSSKNKRSES